MRPCRPGENEPAPVRNVVLRRLRGGSGAASIVTECWIWAATQAHVRDPNIIKRRAIDEQMRDLAKKHMAMPGDPPCFASQEDVIWTDNKSAPRWKLHRPTQGHFQ